METKTEEKTEEKSLFIDLIDKIDEKSSPSDIGNVVASAFTKMQNMFGEANLEFDKFFTSLIGKEATDKVNMNLKLTEFFCEKLKTQNLEDLIKEARKNFNITEGQEFDIVLHIKF